MSPEEEIEQAQEAIRKAGDVLRAEPITGAEGLESTMRLLADAYDHLKRVADARQVKKACPTCGRAR